MLSVLLSLLMWTSPMQLAGTGDASSVTDNSAASDTSSAVTTTDTSSADNSATTTDTSSADNSAASSTTVPSGSDTSSSDTANTETKADKPLISGVKIGSEIFAGYSMSFDDNNDQTGNSFVLDRARINLMFTPDKYFRFRLTTDLGSFYDIPANYVKYAWGEIGNLIPGLTDLSLRFGLDTNAWKNFRERTTGLRFIAKMPVDMYKFTSSAEMGAKLIGYITKNDTSSFFLSFGISNDNWGNYYDRDKDKAVDVMGIFKMKSFLPLTLGFYFKEGFSDSAVDASKEVYTTTLALSVDVTMERFLFGLEYALNTFNEYEPLPPNDKNTYTFNIISLYGVVKALPKTNGFIRFDQIFNSSHTVEYSGQGQKMIAGITYELRKGLTVSVGAAFSLWHDKDINDPVLNSCTGSSSDPPYCHTIAYSKLSDGEKSIFVRTRLHY